MKDVTINDLFKKKGRNTLTEGGSLAFTVSTAAETSESEVTFNCTVIKRPVALPTASSSLTPSPFLSFNKQPANTTKPKIYREISLVYS